MIFGLLLAKWEYSPDDDDSWANLYPQCGGTQQSPIILQTSVAKYKSGLGHVKFNNYSQAMVWSFLNNGHTSI